MSATDPLLPLPVAVERATGARVNPATCWRWSRRGVLDPTGERVILETTRLGGRCRTSVAAVQRFVAATNGEAAPASTGHTNRQREAAIRQAEAELARHLGE